MAAAQNVHAEPQVQILSRIPPSASWGRVSRKPEAFQPGARQPVAGG